MKEKIKMLNVMKFAGAFIAFIIGSGFATGQEIMQFFTSNGLNSLVSILISLILFTYFGSTVMAAGYDYGSYKKYRPYKYFCGNKVGLFYEYVVPVLLFISVIVMISGAGATLQEYYGLNYYVGCAMMTILVLIAFICGLDNLINIIGFIGPVIVIFSLIVGFTILIQNLDGLNNISQTVVDVNLKKAGGDCVKSGILYASYNMVSGLFFFTSLGNSADTRREAKYGAVVGSVLLIIVILVMNFALLSKIKDIYKLSIPTLYFAKSISPTFGKIFSVVLLCGIFSTAAPNFWTVCDKVSKRGKYNSNIIALIISILAFSFGLFPFEKLVGNVYPLTGILGVVLFICICLKQIRKRII
ncbi:YkvI family membrane protein [Terrisporobacter vanillatitrophus]|uniref:YkvI family membrane protein n=1 Tax=Terrisporobacter vanillatitrophus TaxID=3058402 RepID=UPI003366B79E